VEYAYPAWVEASKTSMDVMKKYMDKDQQVKLDYASSYASTANYWKNRQGMIDALKQHKTAESKRNDEKAFQKWASKKENKKYADVMTVINNYYSKTNENSRHANYIGLLLRPKMASIPYRLGNDIDYYLQQNEAKQAELAPKLSAQIEDLYEGIYLPLEKDVLAAQLKLYSTKAKNIAPLIAEVAVENNKTDAGWNNYVDTVFKNSIFETKEKLQAFMANPNAEVLKNDPLFQLSTDLFTRYRSKTEEEKQLDNDFEQAYRLMVQGMRLQNPEEKYYPDANSTLRLTY